MARRLYFRRWSRTDEALIPLLMLVTAPFVAGQTLLSPDEAVRLALEHNAFLGAASARVHVSEGQRTQAGLKPNPRLFLQSENARIPVSAPFRYDPDTDNFAYLSQVFERGGKRERRIELAGEHVKAAGLTVDQDRVLLAGRVLIAYWSAAGAQRLAAVLGESLGVLERTVEYQRNRVREGSLPEADLIRVQLEYQQVAISLRNAQQDSRRLLQLLYREIGMPPQPDVKLTGDLSAMDSTPPQVDVEAAVESRPDVRLALQSVQQAKAATRLQQANAKPDPEVLLGYKRTGGFNTLLAGVQINLPFQNRNQGAIAAAAAEETAAAATVIATRAAARTEIEALLGDYQQKRELVGQMLPVLRNQASETRRIADAVYREGASDLLRLLDAERVRIDAETLYVRSMLEYRQAAIHLQIALGRLP